MKEKEKEKEKLMTEENLTTYSDCPRKFQYRQIVKKSILCKWKEKIILSIIILVTVILISTSIYTWVLMIQDIRELDRKWETFKMESDEGVEVPVYRKK